MGEAPAPSALVDFVAGTVGGIASLLAGHPFDTVKTRLQAQPSPGAAAPLGIPDASRQATVRTPLLATASSSVVLETESGINSTSTSTARYPNTSTSSIDRIGNANTHPCRIRPAAPSAPIYKSAWHAFSSIIREEKVVGLYKGVTSPMLGVAAMNASVFGLYELALRFQQSFSIFAAARPGVGVGAAGNNISDSTSTSTLPTLSQVMVAGMLSGIGSSVITSPIDLIKIREQMYRGPARVSTWKVLVDVVTKEGFFRGLYRGWATTAIRDLGYGPYFLSYEWMNRTFFSPSPSGNGKLSPIDLAISGSIAGLVGWISTFWADVIKTKIQASSRFTDSPTSSPISNSNSNSNSNPTSRTPSRSLFWSTARQTYSAGGIKAFFVGVGPTILRAIPVNAVLFVTFEATKDFLVHRGY
ncbi:mitochondrial carrier [Testicularia cyperi]|uniref:Mitochondrial carrier n=1 Tax=Testicularia cyperi TaxID=1882483 RepID=A0A317XEA3_9BASI|nr:mitochondrial carrier [Testicularia cyperi]